MKTLGLSLLAMSLLAFGTARGAAAEQAAPQSVDKTPPSYDMKAQSLYDLEDMQKKFVSLAQAIPADKFTWRPGEGVRSFSEAFLHVANMNFQMPAMIGATPAPGYKKDGYEKSSTDKDKIIEQLSQSFEYVRAYVNSMTNADFARPEKQFGPDANAGDIVYLIVTDDHEHLGQTVAYARVNGIVPPWTAERLKKQAKSGQ
ncbi:MAG TPA: DinB family protein [Verrucomicrobiae bacterium]|nr:DinB family protein [Verrucomicrobiae bacterium]